MTHTLASSRLRNRVAAMAAALCSILLFAGAVEAGPQGRARLSRDLAERVASGRGEATDVIVAGSAVGVGLTVIGAAYGIGRLAGSALESMARQPEVAGSIQTAMIIAAALIEGFTFFALFICWGQKF